ncbi:MAG TPA: hypothetical protein VMN82_01865 [Thermoanaerobaculia bacterium]|nr:hypothetical protein [Thermoanaerobaculia bacterium]
MSRVPGPSRATVLALAVILLVAGGAPSSARQKTPTPQAACVLTNPAYSGKCTQMTPLEAGSTPATACQAVVACLNNVDCLKTYCNATTVRNGWKLESAK